MTETCQFCRDRDAALDTGSMLLCAECHERHWAPSGPEAGAKGEAFASELLFVKWRDGRHPAGYGGAARWVADCPEGADPRSTDNPHVFTWGETLESDWGSSRGETWYIVGARGPRWWVGIDVDIGADHAQTAEFDPLEELSFHSDALAAVSKSGGPHIYALADSEPPRLGTDLEGVDLLSDSPNVRQAGAVSPWHDGRRGVLNDPEPADMSRWLDTPEGREELASVEGRGAVLRERMDREAAVDLDIPDEPPEELPVCVGQLCAVRSSQERNRYPGSPFAADTHLGMMLCANGYPMEDALAVLREHPPDKPEGFDEHESRYQLEMLYRKMRNGDMHPPTQKLVDAGIDVGACGCAVHGSGRELGDGLIVPDALSDDEQGRRDRAALQRARSNVRDFLTAPVEDGVIYHAPQGLGKTQYTAIGSTNQKRVVVTTNKGEHRDTLEHFAEEAGATYDEVTPFADSWLCSGASPVSEECMDLYRQGVRPKFLISEYKDVMPEDVECPYISQFEGDPSDADLLMASPGHENIERFRQAAPSAEGEDPAPRCVVYDDVNPADHEIEQNMFSLDSARAELNELIQELDELESSSVSALLTNADDLEAVGRIAVGDGSASDEPEQEEPGDVWEALELAAAEDDAIRVDVVDLVRRREHVRGDTVIKLKVVAGAEVRGVTAFSWSSSGDDVFSWVAHPDLSDHDVAILSATHLPHVTEHWVSQSGAGPVRQVDAVAEGDTWADVRRAQGYELRCTRGARNSRSGAGAFQADPEAVRARMRDRREDLRDAIRRKHGEDPGIIDSKRLLDDGEGINFARVWSNNAFKDRTVGLVAGATYFGDEWVEARAAYCGRTIEIQHEDGRKAWSDDPVGQDLVDYMTSTWVEQSVTRFGRDGDERTVVYVDTDEVPAGFPAKDISDEMFRATDTQMDVYGAIREGAETFRDIASRVDVTRQQVGNVCWQLEEAGLVDIAREALEHGAHQVSPEDPHFSINKVELSGADASGSKEGPNTGGDRVERPGRHDGQLQTALDVARGGDGLRAVPGYDGERGVPDTEQTELT